MDRLVSTADDGKRVDARSPSGIVARKQYPPCFICRVVITKQILAFRPTALSEKPNNIFDDGK